MLLHFSLIDDVEMICVDTLSIFCWIDVVICCKNIFVELIDDALWVADALSTDKIAQGFQVVLDSINDIVLDCPDAADLVSKFLARAIVDEIVAPGTSLYFTTCSALNYSFT